VDCLFGFTGRQFDQATGLQNNLNRWYDPQAGRWLSQDPMGFAAGDANLYNYVSNQPTTYADPRGLAPLSGRLLAGATAGTASGAATGGLAKDLAGNSAIRSFLASESGAADINKLERLGRQAAGATGKQANTLLQKLARQAGLDVIEGGKHLKIIDPVSGELLTTLPRSPTNKPLIKGIVRTIVTWVKS
jgi:RHS repeat-associated protein